MRPDRVTPAALERRVSQAIIVTSAAVFAFVLTILPGRYPGNDEAKYLGIGLDMLNGLGPVTVFGTFFQPHSPLWSVIMAAPRAWLGLDAYAWAHLLNIGASASVIVLAGALGWRIRPAVGAFAAASILSLPYLFALSRHLGLDMVMAGLTLAYLLVGREALRARSAASAIACGAIFAFGFLIKETILPFAAAPFLAGIAAGIPAGRIARVAAWTVLVTAVVTSWWWLLFAVETGRVYRLGTPAWTLIPVALGIALVVAIGFAWDRLTPRLGAIGERRVQVLGGPRPSGQVIAWGLAILWAAWFVVFFNGTRDLRGLGLFNFDQLAYYAGTWFGEARPLIAIGGIGAVIDIASRMLANRSDRSSTTEFWLAELCGFPLALLVAGVGDMPRHLVAQMVLLFVIGASGWLWLFEGIVQRPSLARALVLTLAAAAAAVLLVPIALVNARARLALVAAAIIVLAIATLMAARPELRPRALAWGRQGRAAISAAALAFVVSSAIFVSASAAPGRNLLDERKADAVRQTIDWLRANVAPGATIAFGSGLSMETGVEIRGDYRLAVVRENLAVLFDPRAPLGVTQQGGGPNEDDWIVVATQNLQSATFSGFRAENLIRRLRSTRADYWIQMADSELDAPAVAEPALTPDHGFTLAGKLVATNPGGVLRIWIHRIDPARLSFGRMVWITQPALERLVARLETSSAPQRSSTAGNLVARVVVVPEGPAADRLRARLKALAGE
jgi:hypothetical protein